MPELGDLVRRGRKWVVVAPTHCAVGHSGRFLVGTTACKCGTRHMTWWCQDCEITQYGPPLGDRCRLSAGIDGR